MKQWQDYLRSVQGQMTLFALTFTGAIGLALVALLLRDRLFQPTVRERYPALNEADRNAAAELADRDLPAATKEELLTRFEEPNKRNELYGSWMENPDLDPDLHLARRFAGAYPSWVLDRVQITLAAGSLQQRMRALLWLRLLPSSNRHEALELALFARARAEHENETELCRQADLVLDSLNQVAQGP